MQIKWNHKFETTSNKFEIKIKQLLYNIFTSKNNK